VDKPRGEQAIPCGDWLQRAGAQLDPVGVQEVDCDLRPGRVDQEAAEVSTQRVAPVACINRTLSGPEVDGLDECGISAAGFLGVISGGRVLAVGRVFRIGDGL
jgi:hypothetical protein